MEHGVTYSVSKRSRQLFSLGNKLTWWWPKPSEPCLETMPSQTNSLEFILDSTITVICTMPVIYDDFLGWEIKTEYSVNSPKLITIGIINKQNELTIQSCLMNQMKRIFAYCVVRDVLINPTNLVDNSLIWKTLFIYTVPIIFHENFGFIPVILWSW